MPILCSFSQQLRDLYPDADFLSDVVLNADGTVKDFNLPGTPLEVEAALLSQPALVQGLKRQFAKNLLGIDTDNGRVLRAIIVLLVNELNDLRAMWTNFKAATSASTTLADFKTRVASLQNMPARTNAQVTAAIDNAIDADS